MIRIRTIPTLQLVHLALRTRDPELLAAADSVLSALILVMRREEASVPDALATHLERLKELR